jgi:hypothetical protein
MSSQITTAFITEFSDKIKMLSQQKDSKLKNAVNIENVHGEQAFFDSVGKTFAQQSTERDGETSYIDVPHSRRRVTMNNYHWTALLGKLDGAKLASNTKMQNKYALMATRAMLRVYDKEIIDAALGTASTGKNGAGSADLPSSNIITSGSAGLTLAKVLQTKEILDGNDVDPEDRYFVTSSKQMTNMLNLEKVTSADYNSVKALVEGTIDAYLGFKFIRIDGERALNDPLLPKSGNDRACFAFQKEALTLAINEDMDVRITEMPNRQYATQIFCDASIGAVRGEDAGVVRINCTETS